MNSSTGLIHQNIVPQMPKRVVILGAGGFIGSAFIDQLKKLQMNFLGILTKDIDLSEEGADKHLVTLLKPEDAVVVLATFAGNNRMGSSDFIKNIRIGENICNALIKVDCSQVVYFSSDAVYSWFHETISEKSCLGGSGLYSNMHSSREIMFQQTIRNSPLTIIRSTQIYGFSNTHNPYGPNRFSRSAVYDGKIALFGEGEEKRDFIAIEDVVELLIQVLCYASHGIINFATGESVTFRELAEMIKLISGPVSLEFHSRMQPILHRNFDITYLKSAFPSLNLKRLSQGLKELFCSLDKLKVGAT